VSLRDVKYCADEDGKELILLLVGGSKKTQSRDIEKAKEYWRNYGK